MNTFNPVPKQTTWNKEPKRIIDANHRSKVLRMPCIVCWTHGLVQKSRTTGHHLICGRYSQAKAGDDKMIPLCDCHHQGLRRDRDRTKIAIHQNKRLWIMKYGEDTEYIALTLDWAEDPTLYSNGLTAWAL